MRPNAGLVVISDTRTHAGIDNISTYNKLHILANDADRLIICASAGSLSVTQAMLSMLVEGLDPQSEDSPLRTVATMPTMFRVAQLVGEALADALVAAVVHTEAVTSCWLLARAPDYDPNTDLHVTTLRLEWCV
jgi:predicted proteasome-type protease